MSLNVHFSVCTSVMENVCAGLCVCVCVCVCVCQCRCVCVCLRACSYHRMCYFSLGQKLFLFVTALLPSSNTFVQWRLGRGYHDASLSHPLAASDPGTQTHTHNRPRDTRGPTHRGTQGENRQRPETGLCLTLHPPAHRCRLWGGEKGNTYQHMLNEMLVWPTHGPMKPMCFRKDFLCATVDSNIVHLKKQHLYKNVMYRCCNECVMNAS